MRQRNKFIKGNEVKKDLAQQAIDFVQFDAADRLIAGVDEAGRGPLAGAVFAAAVILDPARPVDGLMDSKKLSEKKRSILEQQIKEKALSWSIAYASVDEIDDINILQASMLAMKRAVETLETPPDHVLVDGNRCPQIRFPVEAIVKGDQLVAEISAASILAKQARDKELIQLDDKYPGYGFAQHKGYGTKQHLEAIQILGPTPVHRKSFRPICDLVVANTSQVA
ncbi:MAG: ribonuclease HII [Gammaproteobacteria bacterium]|nr:MAG: ribonuclease HII [Gammaproteobacteria bacterium]